MKLLEYQLKTIFKQYEIPIPDGKVTSIAREAKRIAEDIGEAVVVKAQVLAEGRGAAGGIRLARTPQETELFASQILASTIQGRQVSKVLVDEAVIVDKEYYIFITYSRALQKPVIAMYNTGSVYIETSAAALDDNLDYLAIDPLIGLQQYQIFELASRFDFPPKYQRRLFTIVNAMWRIFCDKDATLVAINPLVITNDGRMLALDGKITIDDHAFFRQQSVFDTRVVETLATENEYAANKYGMYYFKMDGNIGLFSNATGVTMFTIDYVKSRGGRPADYLDLGGSARPDNIEIAMRVLSNDPNIDIILINIFGGRVHCDEAAERLLASMKDNRRHIPVIACFGGTGAEKAVEMLAESPIKAVTELPAAVDEVFNHIGEPYEHPDQ